MIYNSDGELKSFLIAATGIYPNGDIQQLIKIMHAVHFDLLQFYQEVTPSGA
jgi:hypothetical protein